MESSARTGTVGELLLALYEMGFEEWQVRAALKAGCFQVQEAAEWILQGGHPRGTLHTQLSAEPGPAAVSAFNPPQDVGAAARARPLSPESHMQDAPAGELQPLSSARQPQHRKDYEERRNASLAQEIREEKRAKKKERDLVLRRIAEDRQTQHSKGQILTSPPTADKLGSTQLPPNNHCSLMIRLPSGQRLRLGFAAEVPLRSVCERVNSLQPSLAPCRLLQTFPTRHFTEDDLPSSLQELGLTPSATLCVRGRETPSAEPPSSSEDLPRPEPLDCRAEDLMLQGDRLFPVLSSPAESVAPNVQMKEDPAPHRWGRGQRLTQEDEDDGQEEQQRFGSDGIHQVLRAPPELGSPSHQWPSNGLRLRAVDESNGPSPPGSASSPPEPPHLLARAAAEMRQESAKSPTSARLTRLSAIPTLRNLTLCRALAVISAPSMQFSGSLSGLTPDLAEMIIDYMVKERVLRPKSLELFTGCPISRMTLTCYPYCTNDLIRQLRGFPGLRHLNLSSANLITDPALCVLQHLHKLQHLNLSSCRNLSESCLLHLRGLKHLSHLVLDQTRVSDAGMCDFLQHSRCPLTYLSINQTAVTERTLSLLVQHRAALRVLSLKHTQVSDVSCLCGLSHLTSLHLDGTQVTQRSLQVVRSLPALSTLTLSGAQSLLSDHVLELLSGLSLTRLVLPDRHSLSDEGLSHLCQLRDLRELDLTDHTQITDRGVQHVSQLGRLRVLSLCNTSVTDAGLTYLQGLGLLEELSLDRTKVTSTGVSQCIPHLPHLQVLSLSGTAIGDNVLKLGVQKCRSLLKVNLSRTRVTNKGLRFLSRVPIVQINLDGTGVTPQGVSDLMATHTDLTSVRSSGLQVIPSEQVSDEEAPPTC